MSYQRTLRIQKERIGAIIGKKGSVKEEIEKKCKISIVIDSEYGDIILKSNNTNFLNIMDLNKALEIVMAISKGFSPERAFNLFKEDNSLEIIDLRDYVGKSPNSLSRVKSRLIGEKGKSRRTIEELTGSYISIYGHYIGIIGTSDQINLTLEAITRICSGRSHKNVYNFLQEIRRKAKIEKMKLWEESNNLTLRENQL
ncbi:MAG TPA: KH domain-containing protein [Nitrososphaeraceae archaeon]|nr:KH domain-containing protein [Nitrososphaeraceae archaeon]